MPDGIYLDMGDEAWQGPEILFNPSIIGRFYFIISSNIIFPFVVFFDG